MTALTGDQLLSFVGKLDTETATLEGMGDVICRELTGTNRAKVLGVLTPALQAGGVPDFERYQEMLLQLGTANEDGTPLLDMAGAKKAMGLGAGKVERICGTIERLSGLDGKKAETRAEGNSETTPSSTATSA